MQVSSGVKRITFVDAKIGGKESESERDRADICKDY